MSCNRRQRGFTLTELTVGLVSTSILMGGMLSCIFLASRSASSNTSVSRIVSSSFAINELAAELSLAKRFYERSPTGVTFDVPDQDANGTDETIRYTYDSSARTLTRSFNGVATTFADEVYNFYLAYTTASQNGTFRVLFLQGSNSGTQATYDSVRRSRVAAWNFKVIPFIVTASTTQAELDSYLGIVDAVYVSSTVTPADLGAKLKGAAAGVLIENRLLHTPFGFSSANGITHSESETKIVNNKHYITETFTGGPLQILTSAKDLCLMSGTMATGAIALCSRRNQGSQAGMVVIPELGQLSDGTAAAGPRVMLPWGEADFDPSVINSNGTTLWRRSLEWASGAVSVSAVDISMQIGSSSTTAMTTRVECVNKPRP